jgi:hypothetical protein
MYSDHHARTLSLSATAGVRVTDGRAAEESGADAEPPAVSAPAATAIAAWQMERASFSLTAPVALPDAPPGPLHLKPPDPTGR